ncbi:hypothetical protein WDH52_17240 [Streptomyces sp. TRM70308]|uniref:hypothetical protein n=1 Tax=Streptomyces sp. TRM70308 TaxID=3131932 RepID=UPI003D023507
MAAAFLHRIHAQADGKKRRGDDGTTRDVLDILSGQLNGSGPVLFEFAHWAEKLRVPAARLQEVAAWLVEQEFHKFPHRPRNPHGVSSLLRQHGLLVLSARNTP